VAVRQIACTSQVDEQVVGDADACGRHWVMPPGAAVASSRSCAHPGRRSSRRPMTRNVSRRGRPALGCRHQQTGRRANRGARRYDAEMSGRRRPVDAPSTASGVGEAKPLTVLGRLAIWQPPVWDDDTRTGILNELFFEGLQWRPFLGRFSVLLVLSTTIAGLGLIADSAAVVIGAMLIAPLMTPILAVGGAAVHGQSRRLLTSGAVLLGGTVGAVATGWLVAATMPGELTADELTGELLARTAPSLLDLGIAIAAGLAGGFVLTHPRAGSSLPGVAIAVALVPPLATVGITLQVGATSAALGALLLYTTNMVAIILSAMIVMLASGFVPPEVRRLVQTRVRFGLLVATLAVVAVEEWDSQGRVVELSSDTGPQRATVEVVMASARTPAPAWRLAELLAPTVDTPIDVDVQYRVESHDEATAG
jgi:uncharacterized hydrophobic protein (TIGR00271 family)